MEARTNTIVRGIVAVIAGILFGGIVNMGLIIEALDLVVAYLPMGWLGGVIAMRAGAGDEPADRT